jgi:class 3 adenylate cyclase
MSIALYCSRFIKTAVEQNFHCNENLVTSVEAIVVYFDLVGSTEISEQYVKNGVEGVEELHRIYNHYFAKVFSIVESLGGDVLGIDGDATVAFWAVNKHSETSAELRACAAAQAVVSIFSQGDVESLPRLHHKVGIEKGELFFGILQLNETRRFLNVYGSPLDATFQLLEDAEIDCPAFGSQLRTSLEHQVARLEQYGGSGWNNAMASLQRSEEIAISTNRHDDDEILLSFVTSPLASRLKAGQITFLPELRTLSMVYIRVLDKLGKGQQPYNLEDLLSTIDTTAKQLDSEIIRVQNSDKGLVVVLACGLPLSASDQSAVRSIETASRIFDLLKDRGLRPGIGVATGTAFCGDVGNHSRREYLMTGAVMYTAARLMQAADNSILVDLNTQLKVADHFTFAEHQLLNLKGKLERAQVAALQGRKRSINDIKTKDSLFGRSNEIAQFDQALQALLKGKGGVQLFAGDPGSGKSSLLRALGERTVSSPIKLLFASCSMLDHTAPFGLIKSIILSLLQFSDDDRATRPRQYEAQLRNLLGKQNLQLQLQVLEEIFPEASPTNSMRPEFRLEPQARYSIIEDLVLSLLRSSQAKQPVLIVVDDFQWIDEVSSKLLLASCEQLPEILVILGSRPIDTQKVSESSRKLLDRSSEFTVNALDPSSSKKLIEHALEVQFVPEQLFEFVERRAGGLPLHIEQLLFSLLDRQVIEVRHGLCFLDERQLAHVEIPESLRELLLSRIDGLAIPLNLFVKVASSIGLEFEQDHLAAIYPTQIDTADLHSQVNELVALGLLEIRGTSGATTIMFRHMLLRDAAYETLPYSQRTQLHLQNARTIETQRSTRLDEFSAQLAFHWEGAKNYPKALEYCLRAGIQSLNQYANHEALEHVARANSLLMRSPSINENESQRRLLHVEGNALHELSRFQEANMVYARCAQLNDTTAPATKGSLLLSLTAQLIRQALHRFGFLRKLPSQALMDQERYAAHIFTRFAEHAYFNGEGLRLVHSTVTALNFAERAGATREVVEGLGGLAIGLGTAGQHGLANYYRHQAVSVATIKGMDHEQGFGHMLAGVYAYQAGRWVHFDQHSKHGAAFCQKLGDKYRYQICRVLEGYGLLLRGNYQEAYQVFSGFGQFSEQVNNLPVRAWVLSGWSLLDAINLKDPQAAIRRLAILSEEPLQYSERVLVSGILCLLHFQAHETQQSLNAAEITLDLVRKRIPTMGIAMHSLSAVAECLIAASTIKSKSSQSAHIESMAKEATQIFRTFSKTTRISVPRAHLVAGKFAMYQGKKNSAIRQFAKGLKWSKELEMPLETASLYRELAQATHGTSLGNDHDAHSRRLLAQLKTEYWIR